MKKIIVTKPSECPFRRKNLGGRYCGLTKKDCDELSFTNFPPDCPLFENDYIIKRRSEDVTGA